MKIKNYLPVISLLIICNNLKAQSANTSLSNLISPTKVNVSLLPSKDSSINLGSDAKNWKNIFIKGKIYIGDTPTIYSVSNNDFFAGPNAGIKLKYLYGQQNTGIGTNALYYGGYSNTAVGWDAMEDDSLGGYNAALGVLSLNNNTSGNYDVAVGDAASYQNLTGSYNTSVGYDAADFNFSGSYNTSIGAIALHNNKSSNNTAIGDEAGKNNSTGGNNTYVGFHAGNTVTTGSSNTIIGYGADVNNSAFSNATAIGNLAVVGASNHIHIGNSSVTSIGGQVSWTSFSDERIKNNIKENVPGLAFINLLKPVTYNFDLNKQAQLTGRKGSVEWKEKYDIEKIQFSGFLAQDVEAAAKKINYDFSGVDVPKNNNDVYGLRYSDFVVPLIKAVQELSKMNDSKDSIINNLETRLARIESLINTQQLTPVPSNTGVSGQQSTVSISSVSLQQNIPNPFTNSTTISYSIPQQFSLAKIIFTDKKGNAVKQITLSGSKGSINIDAATFASGTYQYALYIDGKFIDAKQMQSLK